MGLLHSRKREPSPQRSPRRPRARAGRRRVGARRAGRDAPAAAAQPSATSLDRSATAAALCAPWAEREGRGDFAGSLERVLARRRPIPSPLLQERSLRGTRRARGGLARSEARRQGRGRIAQRRLRRGAARRLPPLPRGARSPVDSLPMAMPISLRSGDHPMGGNRFAGARFAAPVGADDPASASRPSTSSCSTPATSRRSTRSASPHRCSIACRRPSSPSWYAGQTAKIDLQASNVAGLPWGRLHRGREDRAHAAVRAGARLRGDGDAPVLRGHLLHRLNMDAAADHRPGPAHALPASGTRRGAGAGWWRPP